MHRSRQFRTWLFAGLTLASLGLGAELRPPLDGSPRTNPALSSLAVSNAPLRRLDEGRYALGLVQLDKNQRTVSFPCEVNMTEGVVEYALVHRTGKVHESVLKTAVDPAQIHLAWLLLTPGHSPEPPGGTTAPPDLAGPRIRIWAQWMVQGVEKRVALEDLVSNTLTRSRMSRGPWVYNGSRVVEGTFLAGRDGSIVAIIADPDALVNNPRPGRDDDEIWTVNRAEVAPVGTRVQVTFELADHPEP
jgi:hypothetical protein